MRSTLAFSLCLAGILMTGCSGGQTYDDSKSLPPLVGPSEALAKLAGFAGEYVIIDARMASDVASPLLPDFEPPIGESIRFTRTGIELEGGECDDWQVTELDAAILPVQYDPNLIDLVLGPIDSPNTVGDQQQHVGFVAKCEGETVFRFHKVDDRVLVMPTENSAVNLILERPLSEVQIKAYQAQLKSMKFYEGELTGELDDATLTSSRYWFEYRARLDDTQPIPARPAITENLLDALRVLNDPNTQE